MNKKISQMYIKEYFNYSDGVMIRIKNKYRSDLIGKPSRTVRPDGYVKIRVNGSYFYEHVLVWVYFNG
jgi:hypothetical protein